MFNNISFNKRNKLILRISCEDSIHKKLIYVALDYVNNYFSCFLTFNYFLMLWWKTNTWLHVADHVNSVIWSFSWDKSKQIKAVNVINFLICCWNSLYWRKLEKPKCYSVMIITHKNKFGTECSYEHLNAARVQFERTTLMWPLNMDTGLTEAFWGIIHSGMKPRWWTKRGKT